MSKAVQWIPALLFYLCVSPFGLVTATIVSGVAGFLILLWQRRLGKAAPLHSWSSTGLSVAVGLLSMAMHSAIPVASIHMVVSVVSGMVLAVGALFSRYGVQVAVATQVSSVPRVQARLRDNLRLPFGVVGTLWTVTGVLFLLALPGGHLARLRIVSDVVFVAWVVLLYLWVNILIRKTLRTEQGEVLHGGVPRPIPPITEIPTPRLIGFYRHLCDLGKENSDAGLRTIKEIRRRINEAEAREFLELIELRDDPKP